MEHPKETIAPYARSITKLLQGAVFDDQRELWNQLLEYQEDVKNYFEKIGLRLIIDRRDGYAYLKQVEIDEKGNTLGLMRRMPLTYELTVVCVFLREWLMEFEQDELQRARLIISPGTFRDRLKLIFNEHVHDWKLFKDLNRYMMECEKMGFLKLITNDTTHPDACRYEVKRIIKARITNRELEHFKNQLQDELKSI
ncbi:MAG: DUF4194 domain-containing protein [Marinilabiliaceae bacterium]|nr:DUF4194 domain-containing protein [Marinilabiliaceae bacterium]